MQTGIYMAGRGQNEGNQFKIWKVPKNQKNTDDELSKKRRWAFSVCTQYTSLHFTKNSLNYNSSYNSRRILDQPIWVDAPVGNLHEAVMINNPESIFVLKKEVKIC